MRELSIQFAVLTDLSEKMFGKRRTWHNDTSSRVNRKHLFVVFETVHEHVIKKGANDIVKGKPSCVNDKSVNSKIRRSPNPYKFKKKTIRGNRIKPKQEQNCVANRINVQKHIRLSQRLSD
jgi:hypothetical protein